MVLRIAIITLAAVITGIVAIVVCPVSGIRNGRQNRLLEKQRHHRTRIVADLMAFRQHIDGIQGTLRQTTPHHGNHRRKRDDAASHRTHPHHRRNGCDDATDDPRPAHPQPAPNDGDENASAVRRQSHEHHHRTGPDDDGDGSDGSYPRNRRNHRYHAQVAQPATSAPRTAEPKHAPRPSTPRTHRQLPRHAPRDDRHDGDAGQDRTGPTRISQHSRHAQAMPKLRPDRSPHWY